jgi:hypothetical protein
MRTSGASAALTFTALICLTADSINGGFYWESHVQWESLWLACERRWMTADFLKGLIKLAAAGVKQLEGKPAGVHSHSRRAGELWQQVADSQRDNTHRVMGFAMRDLVNLAERIAASGWPIPGPLLIPQD